MKILVATFTYSPNVDGVAEAAKTMVKCFRDAGHEVLVATGRSNRTADPSALDDSTIHRFNIIGAPALKDGFRGEIEVYREFIVSLDADIIIFHGWDTWPVEMALPLLPSLRARSVLLSHGQSSHLLNPHILPRGLGKWLRWLPHFCRLPWRIRRFDKVVFLSHKKDWGRFFDARIAQLTGAKNISIIPNGIPEPPNSSPGAFRKDYNIGSGPLFLCIANYSERKNQERAIRAFAEASLPDATFVFIGSELGDYGRRMIALWEQLQSEGKTGRTLFLEGLQRDETITALRDCDTKVLAADAETQPIVLLEAMATSKPFISTNTGCVTELKGGLVVRDATEMAKAMRHLADSPEERQKLGDQGRRDYETHYSSVRTTKAWLELLEELAAD